MVWVLVCVLIVMFGGLYLFLHGREVWRKGARLMQELDTAAAKLQAAQDAAAQRVPSEHPASGGVRHGS